MLTTASQAQVAGSTLPAGTVPVLRGVISGQALVSAPMVAGNGRILTIDQASQRAIIDWRSFDIARDSEVLFKHPGNTASTLNRIYASDPTVIQGRLSSVGPLDSSGRATQGGQVILINQNGIIFDRGTQINAQSLVASTLNLSNERFLSGSLSRGGLTTPAFEGGYDGSGATLTARPDGRRPGAIVIGGAALSDSPAPVLSANPSGSIMIFAPSIENRSGLISAPDGQVILAAGSKAYLALNDDAADITLRGFKVEVEAVRDGPDLNLTNLIRNAGEISADRGNVSLAALAVNQEGRVSATTALQSNGSIFLSAKTRDSTLRGSVTFKAGSVTEVVPDLADKATVPDGLDYAPRRGVIAVEGSTIAVGGTVRAPGGKMTLTATSAQPDQARIYFDAGSETSVAGVWADVSVEKNAKTFRVTSNELKNSPDQKEGVLRGATVTVDLRQSSNILELSGYRNAVERTVSEKAAAGGELVIQSTGSVVQRATALIDVAGGGYRYGAGTLNTTKLLGSDGKIYDIGAAPQQQNYSQLLDSYVKVDARWGQTQSVANPLGTTGTYQDAYAQGLGGGSLFITSGNGLVLDGQLNGGVTVGTYQSATAPRGATLRIGEYLTSTRTFAQTQRIGSVVWRQQSRDTLGGDFDAATALDRVQRDTLALASDQVFGRASWTADGRVETAFGAVEINSNGRILLPGDVVLTSEVGGELVLRAPQIDLGGDVRLVAGNLTIQPVLPQSNLVLPELVNTTERVIVRSGANLSTAGGWINEANTTASISNVAIPSGRVAGDGALTSRAIDGGRLDVQINDPAFQARFERGSTLDVSGGAAMSKSGRVTGGKGGKLSIATGSANQATSDWLMADLNGFSLSTGAELSLSASRVVIDADDANGVLPAATTRLGVGLFSDHGFSKFTIGATAGITVAPGTSLRVEQRNLVVDSNAAAQLATGGELASVSTTALLPEWQRTSATVSLNARAGGRPGAAEFVLGKDASISTDPGGEIALSAVNGLFVDGSIVAPGGKVSLTLNGPRDVLGPPMHIGQHAQISAAGRFIQAPSDLGSTVGTLVNGGSVLLDAKNSGLQIDAGARIDVGAMNKTVDVLTTADQPGPQRRELTGHAGSLTLKSQGATSLEGLLVGHGGSADAAGASFALEFRRPDGQFSLPDERRIVITSGSSSVPAEQGLADAVINVAALEAAGFEKLRLQSENRIEFVGSSTATFERGVRLDAPLIKVSDDARVLVQGSTVALGQSLGPRLPLLSSDGRDVWTVVMNAASPVLATAQGTGELTISGGAVDIFGDLTINGVQRTRVVSEGDVRLIGRPVQFDSSSGGVPVIRQVGSLTSTGNFEFNAAQVYGATRSEFAIGVKDQPTGTPTPGGYVWIVGNGSTPADAYSVGSSLGISAQSIFQEGTLKAPLGQIKFDASALVEMGIGSLTSVSGNGLTVPYGTTIAGTAWVYADGAGSPTTLDAVTPAGKRIEISAPRVNIRPGSTVDLRGSGDVLAVEFVPGSGGDRDVTLQDNTFAIIPKSRLSAMPFDVYTQSLKDLGFGFSLANGRDTSLYDSLEIGTGTAVPAGDYALLPARYALLPDAYLVQIETGAAFRGLAVDQTLARADGNVVVAGFRTASGTAVRESQSVGVVVRPGAVARRASDFNLTGAAFFANAAALERGVAPIAPWDGGRLAIANVTSLALEGQVETAVASPSKEVTGRAAQIDISAKLIAVVDQVGAGTGAPGFVEVAGASLSDLGASVLLGGLRSDTKNGVSIATNADQVVVANSSVGAVRVSELLIAARDSIDVRSGSVLSASGSISGTAPGAIESEASGALIRLSNSAQTRVDRGAASSVAGSVRIGAGATLAADQSLLIDATRSTESNGQLLAGGALGARGSIALSSGNVSLGDTNNMPGLVNGLVLSNADLANFRQLDELVLRGYGSIDFIGTTELTIGGAGRLVLDTPLLRGLSSVTALPPNSTVSAQTVELVNNSAALAAATGGQGTMTVQAKDIVFGAGDKGVSGYRSIDVQATNGVSSVGKGSLRAAGGLTVVAPRIVAGGGSDQRIVSVDESNPEAPLYLRLALLSDGSGPAGLSPTTSTDLGGRLRLEGRSVDVAMAVQAASGHIVVAAQGEGGNDGVTLQGSAVLDAQGRAKDFNGTVVTADGGSVSLTARAGAVAIDRSARVVVSAASEGGNGGRLAVRGSTIVLGGELSGNAAAGARSGSAEFDLDYLADFSAFNTALNAGGFADSRQLRLRSGDLDIKATDHVASSQVTLAVDRGRIDVAGVVGTGRPEGGARVSIFARTGIDLAAGSAVLAQAADAGARGGEVRIVTESGSLRFDREATIDVRAGNFAPAGSVVFGVARGSSNAAPPVQLEGTVRRWSAAGLAIQAPATRTDAAAKVDVEATRSYTVGSIVSDDDISRMAADHAAFVSLADSLVATTGMRDETGPLVGARVLGATEVRSSGDLALAAAWDLTTPQWLAAGRPGTLSVRAAGDLTVSASIGAPSADILRGDTWNIRMAAGADTAAVDPMAVSLLDRSTGGGSFALSGADATVRTGTGRIDIAAARDIRIQDVRSSIYTAGQVGVADTAEDGNNRWAVNGGGISISAGQDIVGAPSPAGDLWVTEWLRRNKQPNNQYRALQPTDWWAYRPRFEQAVGTLAGGDIHIAAGGSVRDLAVMLPTSGRTYRDAAGARQVDVQGGGNLVVRAGEDLVGGSFLVARGSGRVEARGDMGGSRPTQLYVMGTSSGAVPEGAGFDLVAGRSLAFQSVSNPTALVMPDIDDTDPAVGPSFGNLGNVTTFFTYASNSWVDGLSKSGNLSYEGGLALPARTFTSVPIRFSQAAFPGAFPPNLRFAALGGDVVAPGSPDVITTFPSPTASISVLANGSIFNASLYGSDRDPASVITPTSRLDLANSVISRQLDGVFGLRPTATTRRIVERSGAGPYVFELQALEGSIVFDGQSSEVVFPAASRLRAGLDIVGPTLRLQNLDPGDVTEVRAVNGDFRAPIALEIRGPGRLLVQAGRNVDFGAARLSQGSVADIGGVVATGDAANPQLRFKQSARVTIVAGVAGDVDLSTMDAAYAEVTAINSASSDIIELYRQLDTETDSGVVLGVSNVAQLAQRDPRYGGLVALDQTAPRALAAYQSALRSNTLPLGATVDGTAAAAMYRLLNTETDLSKLQSADSIAALSTLPGGQAYLPFVGLDQRFPILFGDYVQRRSKGALPTGIAPIVFSSALAEVVATVVQPSSVTGGDILSFLTSVQTYGGSDIDLWAPGGGVVAGLTTPRNATTVGILTNAGGAIRSVVAEDFNINQGRVITAQGGDILLLSTQGSIDAGRGAQTSLATAPPIRRPILDQAGNQIGIQITIPTSAAGSGIQTLTSDPDGLGPLVTPKPGNVFLFAPAGTIDAGEAGIRSSGNIVLNAQTVLNASNISVSGASTGVPVVASGSLASSLATSSSNPAATSKSGDDASAATASAAKAAAAAQLAKPTILVVEVLGFGDKNCKEQDKNCFAK